MRPNLRSVVVGGGIIGIFSALFLAKFGHRVCIIEQSRELGGLHTSDSVEGYEFDRGTHIPSLTGVKEIDDLIFGKLEDYACFDFINTGNFFGNRWNETSSLIDGRALPRNQYLEGLYEIFHNPSLQTDNEPNLAKYITTHFGPTLSKEIYSDVLAKLCGCSIDKLGSEILDIYGLRRLILLSKEKTIELKKIKYFDQILGAHDGHLRRLPLPIVYPKSDQGIKFWIDGLVHALKQHNVRVIKGRTVKKILREENTAHGVLLSDQEKLDVDTLVWSIPPSIALNAAGIPCPPGQLEFRTTTLFHFIFPNNTIKKKQMYLWVWEKGFDSFRITLYNNIFANRFKGSFGLTVECLTSLRRAQDLDEKHILRELIGLGVIEDVSPVVMAKNILPNTFPVITENHKVWVDQVAAEFQDSFSNAFLVGKSSGAHWFTRDLLVHAFDRLLPLIKSSGS